MQLLLALNAALMFVIVLSGWSMYQEFTVKMRAAENLLAHPEKLAPLAQVVMQDAASAFLFGAVNGSIAQFIGDMVRPEIYASLATSVSTFSNKVMGAFQGGSCNNYVSCPNSPSLPYSLTCSNGKQVWCQYVGQYHNCGGGVSCVEPTIYGAASIANSVSSLIAQLTGPSQSTNNNAAFSTGAFNLEAVVPWVQRQTNVNDWLSAGTRCQSLVQKVNNVDWFGSYVDFDGRQRSFNVSHNVQDVTGYFSAVCDGLVKLSTQEKK
ncbi:membrane-associated protein, putative [Bodo saltans]|uniref:Membrane-associated protein, putative n=1 Tax=Bodo saltans TaxID=75058 RepID=A0A0S4J0J9_BODSA|nr:membrane-associated protein, putative [Bodo saltans]|eukprot:CUG32767.1 membrane-associated protein, putative [Bodo saltans]